MIKILSIAILTLLVFNGAVFAFDPKTIYQVSAKSVVLIVASDMGSEGRSLGAGSIISADGLILTNAHVIYSDETNRPYNQITVYLKPEHLTGDLRKDTAKYSSAVVIDYSVSLDLATLKIRQLSLPVFFPFLKFANPENIEIGDPVVAIGHPEQGGLWTLTAGAISSQIENFQNVRGKSVFQTDASINRGNSGGPLIDKDGLIVGINSNISRKGEDGAAITGINFAIKSNVATGWLNSLGYSYGYAAQQKTKPVQPEKQNATIAPVPAPTPPQPEIKPQVAEKPAVVTKPRPYKEAEKPAVVTEPRPYKEEDLFRQTENEMEKMMRDMRGKLGKRPN